MAIQLLHLSDLQFGQYHRFGPKGLLKRLGDDLAVLRRSHDLRPDLIAVTGDFTEWGKKAEFDDALTFLDGLCRSLDLGRERVVLVPGNHDVNRKVCESYFLVCEADDEEPVAPYWPKWRQYAAFFETFYREVPRFTFTEAEPWTLYAMDELKLVVAGLNSTMAESHRDGDHFGQVGEKQLRWFREQLRPYQDRGWLRVGVIHHNVFLGAIDDSANLRDVEDLDRFLGPELHLLLHGHTHEAKLAWLRKDVPNLAMGSASVDESYRPAEGPNQYEIVQIRGDGFGRWARQYEARQKRWIGSTGISETGDDWKAEHPIAFADVHAAFPDAPEDVAPRWVREDPLGDERLIPYDDLLARVERICRLRETDGTEIRRIHSGRLDYLSVTSAEGEGIFKDFAVGAIDDVTSERFDAFLEIHRRYRHADSGVVSTLVYAGAAASHEIAARARRERVRLRSFVEYQGLIDFRSYVERQTLALARDPVYRPELYVEQRLRYRLGQEDRDREGAALTTVRDWLFEERGRFVLVLGDFGTGKTFLLRELARRLGEEGGPVVPILIELRALEKSHDLDVLLASHLVLAGMAVAPEKIRYMLREGRVALLFDGFDELALRVSYDRALDHFATLAAAAQGNAKVVVTSRTQHFESDRQVRTVLGEQVRQVTGHRVVYLQSFDHGQIRRFLLNQLGDETAAEDRFRLLDEVKDLIGLSENPRMLGFISELSDAELCQTRSEDGGITPASLYQAILGRWLGFEVERQEPRGAPLALSQEQRWDAVMHLAMCLWERAEKSLPATELAKEVQNAIEIMAEQRMTSGEVTHQVSSGTLLVRDAEGAFSFISEAVLEWLVARHAAIEVKNTGTSAALEMREISPLMAGFFRDLVGTKRAEAWVRAALEGDEIARKNAFVVRNCLAAVGVGIKETLRLTNEDLRGRDFSNAKLDESDFTGADLTSASFVGSSLFKASLCDVRLVGADLRGADMRNADLRNADLSQARLIGVDLRNADLGGCRLWRTKLLNVQHEDVIEATGLTPWHSTPVSCTSVAWHPGQEILVIGDTNSHLRLWDVTSGLEIRQLPGHRKAVNGVCFSPDGSALASASADCTVRIWDVESGCETKTLLGHSSFVTSVCFSPEGSILASASVDNTVRLWDVKAGREIRALPGRQSVCFSPDGSILASASEDNAVRLWNVKSGQEIMSFKGHSARILNICFSPDGSVFASASADRTLRVWSINSESEIKNFQGHEDEVIGVCFSPDGTTLASASRDRTVRLWDVESGRAKRTFRGHHGSVLSIAFNPGGSFLASAASDQTVRLWDIQAGDEVGVLQGYQNPVNAVCFHPHGTLFASASADRTVRLWDVGAACETLVLKGHQTSVTSVCVSPGGSRLASASLDKTVRLWDIASGKEVRVFHGHRDPVTSVCFNSDGSILVSGSADTTVRLWNIVAGIKGRTFEGHRGSITSVCFSPDGSYLASGSSDDTVRLWDVESGRETRILQGHQSSVTSVCFSPDASSVASASSDKTARLWDVFSGQEIRTYQGHLGRVTSVCFSPDGSRLASGSSDRTVRLWDVESGDVVRTLQGHQGSVTCVSFSPNGSRLASASTDNSVRLWDVATGSCGAVFVPLPEGWVVYTQTGRYKLSGDTSGMFWHSIGLCRYETWELDPYMDVRVPGDDPLFTFSDADMSPMPFRTLGRIAAAQVSPYQTGGGVHQEALFFGREDILAHILQKVPANYLIVSGRQLGKSSLLHAIKRRLAEDPTVDVHYLALSGSNLTHKLGQALGLRPNTSLDDVLARLAERDRRTLFLIDEADVLVRTAHRQLGHGDEDVFGRLRSLSEEGRCHFILTGFWSLYEAAVLDYASPLRNFGETLRLQALEEKACIDLATVPMASIGLSYEEGAVAKLVERTGRRANLIAIACNEIVKQLSPSTRTVTVGQVQAALASPTILDALEGWKNLSADEEERRLDRAVVYATIDSDTFTHSDVLTRFQKAGASIDSERLGRSLKRLELAWIIDQIEGTYSYRVPLFVELLRSQDPASRAWEDLVR